MSISVRIDGEPVAQGRPRLAVRFGHARAYDPPKSRNWKAYAVDVLRSAKPPDDRVLYPAGSVEVRVVAVFTLPKSAHRKVPVGRMRHAQRPDAENVAKAVLDAATTAGLWHDDSQVARLVVEKWRGAQGEAPFVQVEVVPL